jgi:hypothetical protein
VLLVLVVAVEPQIPQVPVELAERAASLAAVLVAEAQALALLVSAATAS